MKLFGHRMIVKAMRADMDHGLQWYKRYPEQFLGGVQGLGLEVIGAYAVLLDLMYARGGSTLRDDRHLSGVLGCSKRKATSFTETLIERGKVYEDRGKLYNKKVLEVIGQQKNLRKKRAKAGEKGGLQRSNRIEISAQMTTNCSQNEGETAPKTVQKLHEIPPKPCENNSLDQASSKDSLQTCHDRRELEESNNNSEDKSSSLLLSAQARDDDDPYRQFIYHHPRPRQSDLGDEKWQEALERGVDPQTIIAAAKRYAKVSSTYDRDKVMYSDNWLAKAQWENHRPQPKAPTVDPAEAQAHKQALLADSIKSGKPFLCTNTSATQGRGLIELGLVTEAECKAVGVL